MLNIHPTLEKLIEYTTAHKSSDLHLSAGHIPFVRIDGDLNPVPNFPPISEDLMLEMIVI